MHTIVAVYLAVEWHPPTPSLVESSNDVEGLGMKCRHRSCRAAAFDNGLFPLSIAVLRLGRFFLFHPYLRVHRCRREKHVLSIHRLHKLLLLPLT